MIRGVPDDRIRVARDPPGSPVIAEEHASLQKRTSGINIDINSAILLIARRWTVGRSSAVHAPRPDRQHHFRGSIPVYGIGNLLDRCHPPAERSTPLYLARNLERDVRNRTADAIAGGGRGAAARNADQRSLHQHSERLLDCRCCIFCLPGIKPGKIPGSGKAHHRRGGGRRCSWNCLVMFGGSPRKFLPYNYGVTI